MSRRPRPRPRARRLEAHRIPGSESARRVYAYPRCAKGSQVISNSLRPRKYGATIDKQGVTQFTSVALNHCVCAPDCTDKVIKVANKALTTKVYYEVNSSMDEFVMVTLFSFTPWTWVVSVSLRRDGLSVVLLDVVSRSSCRICSLKIKYKWRLSTESTE